MPRMPCKRISARKFSKCGFLPCNPSHMEENILSMFILFSDFLLAVQSAGIRQRRIDGIPYIDSRKASPRQSCSYRESPSRQRFAGMYGPWGSIARKLKENSRYCGERRIRGTPRDADLTQLDPHRFPVVDHRTFDKGRMGEHRRPGLRRIRVGPIILRRPAPSRAVHVRPQPHAAGQPGRTARRRGHPRKRTAESLHVIGDDRGVHPVSSVLPGRRKIGLLRG